MRILGIDFGLARVGLAVTDPDGRVAFPVKTIVRTTRKALFDELAAVIADLGVEKIVVGLPFAPDGIPAGRPKPSADRKLRPKPGRRTPVPIELVDETLSSVQAEEDLRAAGLSGKRLREALDAQAAVRIVNTFLGGRKGEPCAT
jgi:putative Holliday junction resolvase